jgi:hypothetical protein
MICPDCGGRGVEDAHQVGDGYGGPCKHCNGTCHVPDSDAPPVGSRWQRTAPHDPTKGPFVGYTVMGITNTENQNAKHPPQVVYRGDNGKLWSLPLAEWPGNLKPMVGAPPFLSEEQKARVAYILHKINEILWAR